MSDIIRPVPQHLEVLTESEFANVFVADNMRNGYVDLVKQVIAKGAWVKPRGQATWEVLGARIVLTNPWDAIPSSVGRNINVGIGAAETAQAISGISNLHQLDAVSNGGFSRFANGDILRGAYGPRVAPQMLKVAYKLYTDPDSRQAIGVIWRSGELWPDDSRDIPCTIALEWKIRDGKLHAFTHMRSNDVWLGVPYDFWMFTRIQIALAYVLGVEVGTYVHNATSLHFYERNLDASKSLIYDFEDPKLEGAPGSFSPRTWDPVDSFSVVKARLASVQADAYAAVTGATTQKLTHADSEWYRDTLAGTAGLFAPSSCSYVHKDKTGQCTVSHA